MDGTSEKHSGAEYRARKPHKKSRGGCGNCKKRRIKCDELLPRCSRCTKHNLQCQYPQKQPELNFPSGSEFGAPVLDNNSHLDLQDLAISSPKFSTAYSMGMSPSVGPSPGPQLEVDKEMPDSVPPDEILDPMDRELLGHFLQHTVCIPDFIDNDSYDLKAGITNLAFGNMSLMSSILALAAACQCCDIIRQPVTLPEHRGQIIELLSRADRHHMDALRDVQDNIHADQNHDHILLNPVFMVYYGFASYSVRIHLASTANSDGLSAEKFLPAQSQWIAVFHNVRAAYLALSSDPIETRTEITKFLSISNVVSREGSVYEDKKTVSIERSAEEFKHVLFPILAATSSAAMKKLRVRVQTMIVTEDTFNIEQLLGEGLQSCFASLDILAGIVDELFSNDLTSLPSVEPYTFIGQLQLLGRSCNLSNWLRVHLARSQSETLPRFLRRIIMGFLHRVPTEFLTLVQSTLDPITQPTNDNNEEVGWTGQLPPSVAHLLATEIFAHWLVLVMLLDETWCIGDMGVWELERVMSILPKGDRNFSRTESNGVWWPESMLKIKRELEKYTDSA